MRLPYRAAALTVDCRNGPDPQPRVKRGCHDSRACIARELLPDTTPYLSPRLVLDGLTPDLADRRVPGAPHTIAEIVAHMAFWQDWFRGRCDGTAGPMPASAALGWVAPEAGPGTPSGPASSTAWIAWSRSARRPITAGASIRRSSSRRSRQYTVGDVLVHVGAHNAHHLGQVVLLRQLLGAWPPPAGSWTW